MNADLAARQPISTTGVSPCMRTRIKVAASRGRDFGPPPAAFDGHDLATQLAQVAREGPAAGAHLERTAGEQVGQRAQQMGAARAQVITGGPVGDGRGDLR